MARGLFLSSHQELGGSGEMGVLLMDMSIVSTQLLLDLLSMMEA